jgi:hypothetical protein
MICGICPEIRLWRHGGCSRKITDALSSADDEGRPPRDTIFRARGSMPD